MNEETAGIKFDTLDKLCEALDCEITDLIERINTNKKAHKIRLFIVLH
ncbi:helix-turn-helix domain-containing protein [Peribacillus sp. NPDC096379]